MILLLFQANQTDDDDVSLLLYALVTHKLCSEHEVCQMVPLIIHKPPAQVAVE